MGKLVLATLALIAVLLAGAPASVSPARAETNPAAAAPRLRSLPVDSKPWTGDFEAMAKRRMIRVLVPYSRSLYFVDRGHERGLTADLVRDFECPRRATGCSRASRRGWATSRPAT
jgi:hypothetical protein